MAVERSHDGGGFFFNPSAIPGIASAKNTGREFRREASSYKMLRLAESPTGPGAATVVDGTATTVDFGLISSSYRAFSEESRESGKPRESTLFPFITPRVSSLTVLAGGQALGPPHPCRVKKSELACQWFQSQTLVESSFKCLRALAASLSAIEQARRVIC